MDKEQSRDRWNRKKAGGKRNPAAKSLADARFRMRRVESDMREGRNRQRLRPQDVDLEDDLDDWS